MNTALLQNIHNIFRWAVLLFGVLSLITGLRGLTGKRSFTNSDKRAALFFLLSCDVQLLLGLILYFSKGYQRVFSGGAIGEVMKNPVMRFWTFEHVTGMLIAIILVHIGYAGTKGSKPSAAKFRRLFWFTLVALLIFAVTIPGLPARRA